VQLAPSRNPAFVLAGVLVALLGGPILGAIVAHLTAPGSELAQTTSPLAFVLTFVGGMLLWFGVGVLSMIGDLLHRLLRGRWRTPRPTHDAETLVPAGHGAFLPLSLVLGALAGLVAGLASETGSFFMAFAIHLAAGGGYGALLRGMARQGYLPFPEPS
jgi:hypothetical protein